MRTYLVTTPPWMVGLASGLIFGGGFAAVTRFTAPTPVSWQAAAIAGVIAGLLFGGTLAYASGRQQRDLRAAAGDLPPAQQLEAYRAAVSGQIPANPQIRVTAVRIAQRRIEELRQFRIVSVIVTALLMLGAVMNLTAGEFMLAALLLAAALVNGAQLYQLRRVGRQLQRLSPEGAADQSG
ncbi:hypothetical protein [Kribbella caucasensis]|nr:hypothetical protein [Kribbella sp. VKM Ac-2527]